MSNYKYKTVAFMGVLKSSQGASEVASQLESLINENAAEGWEFYQLGSVNIEVKPGCLAGFLGRDSDYVRYDQIIFRRAAI